MYDIESMASGIASNCIASASSTAVEKSQVVNLIRSGGDKSSVPAEVGDIEASKSLQIYETQKKVLQEQKDAGMTIADATLQLAESIADNMFPDPSNSFFNSLVNAVRNDFYCKGCGNDLLPTPFSTVNGNAHGNGNGSAQLLSSKIRLKTLKRGKTRRRRASRQAAKKYTYDIHMLQKHKGGGRTFAQGNTNNTTGGHGHGKSVASVMNTQEALKKNNAARRITDGMAKNCISYKCCCCGTEQCIKGMKRQMRPIQGDTGTGTVTNTRVNTTTSTNNNRKQLSATRATSSFNKSLHTSKVTKGSDTDGFLRLGTVPGPGPDQSQSQSRIERKLKPLERPMSTKKRKAPAKKKSGLQNFLSSLND